MPYEHNIFSTYDSPFAVVTTNSNIQSTDAKTQLINLTSLAASNIVGIPQASQLTISQNKIGTLSDSSTTFNTVPYVNFNKYPGVVYQDFRARKGWTIDKENIGTFIGSTAGNLLDKRLDGTFSSLKRGNKQRWVAAAYAAASLSPAGAYSVFNRNADRNFGAGWGDHGNQFALRNDFTLTSHVTTTWRRLSAKKKGRWVPTIDPLSIATPFLGDRVQVIDFGQRNLRDIYEWKPRILGALPASLNLTQDFIKFYLTGPKLSPSNKSIGAGNDDVIVFRVAMTSLTDSFNPNWTPVTMIGRADSNQQYSGYSRTFQITFDVYATDRDEMKPIWRKLNALAGYTAPTYNPDSIALEAPWMRITIGDLLYQQPIVINSLSYTLHDADTTWEINIEQDDTMMQAPKHISVTLGFTLITNELPQKGGRFYTLAKRFAEDSGRALEGNDNWLSDFNDNEATLSLKQKREIKKAKKQEQEFFEKQLEQEYIEYYF